MENNQSSDAGKREGSKNASDIPVQCTRCKNKHNESDRISTPYKSGISHLVCPRCKCRNYYDMSPMVAYCYASGLINIGEETATPEGALVFAKGPVSSLTAVINVVARHGYGEAAGQLLVPGVPEAIDQHNGMDAFKNFVTSCMKRNGNKKSQGVVFGFF